jgi:hypothetical protein
VTAHWQVPVQTLRDTAHKALILAGDKVILGLNRDVPGAARSKGKLRLYFAHDARAIAQLPLDAGIVHMGVAAAAGRLYVACEDGTLLCFGAAR